MERNILIFIDRKHFKFMSSFFDEKKFILLKLFTVSFYYFLLFANVCVDFSRYDSRYKYLRTMFI